MTLELLQFIRTASNDQITKLALQFVSTYPEHAAAFIRPDASVLIVTPIDVATLDSPAVFTKDKLAGARTAYNAWDLLAPNKVRLVKYLRAEFGIALKPALDLANWLIEHCWN